MPSSSTPLVTADLIGRPEFERFCDRVFSSLPRRDQQHKAAAYVAGLLRAAGRKSPRTIAAAAGADVNEQCLHHFVSESTWPWRAVRRSVARFLAADQTAHAFVVRHRDLAAGGRRSAAGPAGEDRAAAVRRAYGLWAVTDATRVPLAWWQDEPVGRGDTPRGGGPARRRPEDALVEAYADAMPAGGAQVPLVVDARALSVPHLLRRLRPGVPAVVRVAADQAVLVTEPAWSAAGETVSAAQQVAWRSRNLRRLTPVSGEGEAVVTAVSSLRVQLPEPVPARHGSAPLDPLVADLVCVGEPRRPWPQQLWLAVGGPLDVDLMLYLASLLDQAPAAPDPVSEALGLGDYRGRSLEGFHRHATLVGVAQAYLTAQSRPTRAWPVPGPVPGAAPGPVLGTGQVPVGRGSEPVRWVGPERGGAPGAGPAPVPAARVAGEAPGARRGTVRRTEQCAGMVRRRRHP